MSGTRVYQLVLITLTSLTWSPPLFCPNPGAPFKPCLVAAGLLWPCSWVTVWGSWVDLAFLLCPMMTGLLTWPLCRHHPAPLAGLWRSGTVPISTVAALPCIASSAVPPARSGPAPQQLHWLDCFGCIILIFSYCIWVDYTVWCFLPAAQKQKCQFCFSLGNS